MNALILVTVLMLILVGAILGWAGEFGKGGEVATSLVLLLGLSLVAGYVVALASGSI